MPPVTGPSIFPGSGGTSGDAPPMDTLSMNGFPRVNWDADEAMSVRCPAATYHIVGGHISTKY